MMKWQKIVRLTFEINCVEGLRIGGSGGGLEIGELVDANLSAIREPGTGEFYIPGSSLKGKLRSVLEKESGKEHPKYPGEPCGCGLRSCKICTMFGAHKKKDPESAPTRIVVRDARMSAESLRAQKQRELASEPDVEIKTENTVNRRTGTAQDPRSGERVLPKTIFDGEILVHIYEGDDASELTKFVRHGLGIIQDASSLGASGSRGYGKVRFDKLVETPIPLADLKV
jgi:CRISPR-associated protein Csm3